MTIRTDVAKAIIKTHSERLKIDDNGDPEIAVWHLLDTLQDYAVEQGLDIKAILEDVKEERRIFEANAGPHA